jgi:hypothetical protein
VFATQPVVTLQDAGGNTVTTGAASVTMSITQPQGAILTCLANPMPVSSGVAAFGGCKIDKKGTNNTLTATSGTLTAAVSTLFNIT